MEIESEIQNLPRKQNPGLDGFTGKSCLEPWQAIISILFSEKMKMADFGREADGEDHAGEG